MTRLGAKRLVNRLRRPKPTTCIDFLVEDFNDDAVERLNRRFRVSRPWTLIDYGSTRLQGGWWSLACSTSARLEGVEVRLRSASDPLIIFTAVDKDSARIFLRSASEYHVSLLVSPWPDEVPFERLALERLSAVAVAQLLFEGALRLLSRGRPWNTLTRIVQRVLAGQSFGVQTQARTSHASREINSAEDAEGDVQSNAVEIQRDGDIIAVLNKGDTLHPRAFEIAAREFYANDRLVAVFSDSREAGEIVLRVGWDPLLASTSAYDRAPIFVRSGTEHNGQKLLRHIESTYGSEAIAHIPLPLSDGLERPRVRVSAPSRPSDQRLTVSIVIPTKTRTDLLKACLVGLVSRTDYPSLEVIIVDNGATDPNFSEVLKAASERLKLTTVLDLGPFNFSRLINAGVAASHGKLVLILNDDIEPIEAGWLHRMVDSVLQPGVGAVGARLQYSDGTIQHAGVTMGLGGPCGHLWKGLQIEEAQRNPHVSMPSHRMAVTGACMLVRREVFDSVLGYDETFAVAFNDIDFCLRLKSKGFKTIYRGDAVLTHHESQSRGTDDLDVGRRRRLAAETALFLSRWPDLTRDDPFASPAFDPSIERGIPHRSLRGLL